VLPVEFCLKFSWNPCLDANDSGDVDNVT